METLSEGKIGNLLRSNGITPDSISPIPDSVVYKITVGDNKGGRTLFGSDIIYLKLIDDAGIYRQLVTANEQPPGVGLPESIVVENDGIAALVSAPADGWPLSRVLPVAFFPGVWRIVRDGLVTGYRAMGKYIGTLHRRMSTGSHEITKEFLTETEGLEHYLSDEVRDHIDVVYERAIGRNVPIARIKSDLTPHNAYYRSGDVTLIDFLLRKRPVVREVANLRISLELMGRRLPYATTTKAIRLSEAFEYGYEPPITPQNDREFLLTVFEISYLCKILKSYRRSTSSTKEWMFRAYDRRWVIGLIEQKAKTIDDAERRDGR